MRARRVFAVIWRINAVLLLLTGLGAVALIGFAIAGMSGMFRHERANDPVAEAMLPMQREQIARLSNFSEIKGSKMLRASLSTDDGKGYSKFSGGGVTTTRNILFLDPETGRAHWLMPGMDGIILHGYGLRKNRTQTDEDLTGDDVTEAELLALAYLVIDADSNGDGRIDDLDMRKVALADPDGTRFHVVLNKVAEVNRVALQPNGKLMILYTVGSALRKAEFDPATFAAGSDNEINIDDERQSKSSAHPR